VAKKVSAFEKTEPPSWGGPTQPVTPKNGLKVADVLAGAQFEGVQLTARGIKDGGTAMSWKVTNYDGKGTVDGQSAAIKQAVSARPDVIVLNSIDPRPVQGALKLAAAAKIKVVSGLGAYDDPNPKLNFSGVAPEFDVMSDFHKMGVAAADWIIADSKGKAHVLAFVDTEYPSNVLFNQGVQDELKAQCPGCAVEANVEHIAADAATKLGPNTVTELRRHPNVNYVVPSSDPFVTTHVTSVKQAGMQSRVKVISVGGFSPNMEMVRKQDVQLATVALDAEYVGWATDDQIARATSGKPLSAPVGENVPIALVTHNNAGSGSGPFKVPYDYKSEFKKIWGVG
jgi:ribose transport system substrate-binding protein